MAWRKSNGSKNFKKESLDIEKAKKIVEESLNILISYPQMLKSLGVDIIIDDYYYDDFLGYLRIVLNSDNFVEQTRACATIVCAAITTAQVLKFVLENYPYKATLGRIRVSYEHYSDEKSVIIDIDNGKDTIVAMINIKTFSRVYIWIYYFSSEFFEAFINALKMLAQRYPVLEKVVNELQSTITNPYYKTIYSLRIYLTSQGIFYAPLNKVVATLIKKIVYKLEYARTLSKREAKEFAEKVAEALENDLSKFAKLPEQVRVFCELMLRCLNELKNIYRFFSKIVYGSSR